MSYKKHSRHSKSKKNSTKKPPNSVLKIRVYPDKELHSVWKRWLAAYRYYYNETIALLRCFEGIESINAYRMDGILQVLENVPDWVLTLPGHQRQEACADAVDAYRQAKKNGGEASFKSCRATSQAIQFKALDFKKGTWYSRLTSGMSFTSQQPIPQECEYGTELVYKRGEWFACFPQLVEETVTNSSRVIALDPGNRTFLTGYDGENVLEIGRRDIGRIQRLCLHLDDLLSRSTKVAAKQRFKMRKAAARGRTRIQNLIKDLHNKAVAILVNSYKVIFLPTFDSSQMVIRINGKGKKRKINSKSVRQMLTLSHYKFEQHLKQAARRKGVIVVLCNESYTSKTCGLCGHIHEKLGGAKVHHCPKCGTKTLRDLNGARNILLRALQATAFKVTGNIITLLDSSCLT